MSVLSGAERETAWRLSYAMSLDDLPDGEIAWEAGVWRMHGAPAVAAIGETLLVERRATSTIIPGGAVVADLDRLLSRVNVRAALRLVQDDGMCLVDAVRLLFWAGLREVAR